MYKRRVACTGIDLGSSSVTLVRGEGSGADWRPTHAGVEEWAAGPPIDRERLGSEALDRLLVRLGLTKRHLGRIAVALRAPEAQAREVFVPKMSEPDLRRALPFEARKHFFLDGVESACLDLQILGPAPAGAVAVEEGETTGEQLRLLLVASPRSARDLPIHTLEWLSLEPEVVDLPGLANLNALLQAEPQHDWSAGAVGLFDLGSQYAELSLTHPEGGLLIRRFEVPCPATSDPGSWADYASDLAQHLRETATYYRGRHRREVAALWLAGRGALLPDLPAALAEMWGVSVRVLDPLGRWDKEAWSGSGPRLVTAFGLCCRWLADEAKGMAGTQS